MDVNGGHQVVVDHCTHGSLTSWFGWTIQFLLATIAFACLIVKRFCEPQRYRRPWLIWFFDTSKQGFGAIVVHFSNIIVAELVEGRDPCTLYIISFLLDSSIGLLLLWLLIRLTEYLAVRYRYGPLVFGEYGKPEPLARYWLIQCWAYVVIVLVVKSVITLLLQLSFWARVRALLLWPISRFLNREAELFMVILVIPFFVNVLMFWVTDNFLIMHRTRQRKYGQSAGVVTGDVILAFAQSAGHQPSVDERPVNGNGSGRRPPGRVSSDDDDDAELIDISFEPEDSPDHRNML